MNWGGEIPQIPLADALSMAEDPGQKVRILDVRQPEEWEMQSLSHPEVLYISMPDVKHAISQADATKALEDMNFPQELGTSEDTACLVLCKAGMRSQHIAECLRAVGKTHVANISGGIMSL